MDTIFQKSGSGQMVQESDQLLEILEFHMELKNVQRIATTMKRYEMNVLANTVQNDHRLVKMISFNIIMFWKTDRQAGRKPFNAVWFELLQCSRLNWKLWNLAMLFGYLLSVEKSVYQMWWIAPAVSLTVLCYHVWSKGQEIKDGCSFVQETSEGIFYGTSQLHLLNFTFRHL